MRGKVMGPDILNTMANKIKQLEEENYKHQDTIAGLENALESMKEENERLTALTQELRNYSPEQSNKSKN